MFGFLQALPLSKYRAAIVCLPPLGKSPFFFFLFCNFLEYLRHHDVELPGVQIRLLLLVSLMNKWDFHDHLLP